MFSISLLLPSIIVDDGVFWAACNSEMKEKNFNSRAILHCIVFMLLYSDSNLQQDASIETIAVLVLYITIEQADQIKDVIS